MGPYTQLQRRPWKRVRCWHIPKSNWADIYTRSSTSRMSVTRAAVLPGVQLFVICCFRGWYWHCSATRPRYCYSSVWHRVHRVLVISWCLPRWIPWVLDVGLLAPENASRPFSRSWKYFFLTKFFSVSSGGPVGHNHAYLMQATRTALSTKWHATGSRLGGANTVNQSFSRVARFQWVQPIMSVTHCVCFHSVTRF